MSFVNRQVALSENGMKVVIASDVTAGGITYAGHYYFVFDQVLNEYVYKRFEASKAQSVFLSRDGRLMIVTTTTRIVVYE